MGCCDSAAQAVRYDHLDGTPTYYLRNGSLQRATFPMAKSMHDRMVPWIRHLRYVSKTYGDSTAYKSLNYVASAGAYNCRNDGCKSQHNYGTAYDLDRVYWKYGGYAILCNPYGKNHVSTSQRTRRRYLAVDAVTRRYFHWVLDGYTPNDTLHDDHIHMDMAALPPVCNTGARSDTAFVQRSCNEFMGYSLVVDGLWGSATESAFVQSKKRLNITSDPKTSSTSWAAWNTRAAAHGFKNVTFGSISFSAA